MTRRLLFLLIGVPGASPCPALGRAARALGVMTVPSLSDAILLGSMIGPEPGEVVL